ncbi:MAG: NHL repeat-containing protein [Candidatus Hydrogenedentales bacterium]
MKNFLAAIVMFLFSALVSAEPPQFTISTIAGTGKQAGFAGDGGPAPAAQLNKPTAVAVDSAGNVYIADHENGRVRKVSMDGTITTVMGTGNSEMQQEDVLPAIETNLTRAYGIAVDFDDNLYVISRGHHKLFKVTADGTATRIAGTGTPGFSGDGGPAAQAQLNSSNHLIADDAGNLYIADSGNRRVRKIDTSGVITTIAGSGVEGFSGDGGPATEAQMTGGSAIDRDTQGNLYVADFENHRIRKIDAAGIITTFAGTGAHLFNGDGLKATESNIGEPTGVACDAEGNVYIADQVNNRIRVVTPDGLMHTIAGTGKRGYEGDGGPAEAARINVPDIICVDSTGNVIFPDYLNHTVRKLTRR